MKKLQLFCSTLVILLLCQCATENQNADLIILSDQIYTGIPGAQPEAIAILDHKIVATGDKSIVSQYKGADTKVLDATGSFVMPGFIEGHGHFAGLGSSLMNLNFLKSKSWDEIVEAVKEKVADSKKGQWIFGRGWHQEKWHTHPHDHVHNYPRHLKLSEISPDNPVLLVHASGHGLMANQKAMDMAGITKETADPAGGRIVRDSEGRAIGVFEENAMTAIYEIYGDYLSEMTEEDQLDKWYEGVELAEKECLENGITSFQDAGSSFEVIKRYQEMAKKGELDVRLWAMLRHSAEKMSIDLSPYITVGMGNDYFTCKAIKSELDGALGAFGAWMAEPYSDKPHFYGQNTTTLEEVEAIAEIAYANDMQLCVHSIGDKANHETLNIIEKYAKRDTARDLRWRIEHSQIVLKEDIPRFAEIGAIASMQGIHCTSDAPYVEKRIGYQRAKDGAYNWRGLLDHGAIVTNGTDAPVEDVDPIESFYASVTRKRADNGMEFFTENRMTREEGIRSYTLSNAYAAFEEDIKGTLEVGKYGDIIILSNNLLTCPDNDILDTKVLYTIVGGDVRYDANSTSED